MVSSPSSGTSSMLEKVTILVFFSFVLTIRHESLVRARASTLYAGDIRACVCFSSFDEGKEWITLRGLRTLLQNKSRNCLTRSFFPYMTLFWAYI